MSITTSGEGLHRRQYCFAGAGLGRAPVRLAASESVLGAESLAAGASDHALLDVRLEGARGGALPRGHLSLTETGRAVLAGDVDRVAAIGIDRWLGGVHLEGRGPVWRFDEATSSVVVA